jgi:hypothetical protein
VLNRDVLGLRGLAEEKGRGKKEGGDPDGFSHVFLLTIIGR